MPREDDEMRRTVDIFTEFLNEINHRRKEVYQVLNSMMAKKERPLKFQRFSLRNERRR